MVRMVKKAGGRKQIWVSVENWEFLNELAANMQKKEKKPISLNSALSELISFYKKKGRSK